MPANYNICITIQLCANKWLMLNSIVSIRSQYLKSFNCAQTNKLWLVSEYYLHTICLQIMYIWYIYKQDLALNNLQELICPKTKPNQPTRWTHAFFECINTERNAKCLSWDLNLACQVHFFFVDNHSTLHTF